MKKKVVSLTLVLCMLLSFMPIIASAATSGTCSYNLTWTLDDNGTLTISGTGGWIIGVIIPLHGIQSARV